MNSIRHIVILTGAGISQESGIKTFRDSDGLWENHKVEDVASPLGFAKNPTLVISFYNERRQQLLDGIVAPNQAHLALAQLEKEFNGKVTIITQNIDNLHERAGSQNIIHMHGELLKVLCLNCNDRFKIETDMNRGDRCPGCNTKGYLRPDIVWFGETPYQMDEIENILTDCDLFLSIGTSGNVYPAAGFVNFINHIGKANTIEFNLEGTEISGQFKEHRTGPAGKTVKEFVNTFLKNN